MTAQFEVTQESSGDLTVTGGWVIQARGAARFYVADMSFPISNLEAAVAVGGSGRNVRVSGAPSTMVPVGIFRASSSNEFTGRLFPDATVVFEGDGSFRINDGVDDLVSVPAGFLTTGVPTAPFTVDASSYGETTYNGGVPFSLTVRRESGSFSFPPVLMDPLSSSIPPDTFTASDADHYTGDGDPSWTITVNADGSADIADATAVVATRASGVKHEAGGVYRSTIHGGDTYNDGAEFEISVTISRTGTIEGYVWVEITESSPGVPTGAAGPFFGPTLPSPSGGTFAVPLAWSDGAGSIQPLHTGPVFLL